MAPRIRIPGASAATGAGRDDPRPSPTTLQTHGWWLASRASGLVALVLVTISVGIGLTMAGKVMRRPGLSRKLMAIHEQTALAGLIAIAVHGITLLGDPWLHPGVAGVTVPFAMSFHTAFTGLGDHRRLPGDGCSASASTPASGSAPSSGARRTGRRSSSTLLGLVHALGAGTDASAVWFRWWVILTAPPIAGLFVYRVLAGRAKKPAPAPSSAAPAPPRRRSTAAGRSPEPQS